MFPEETLGKISYVECFPSIFAFLLSNAASISVTCCETKGRRSTIKAEIRVINVNLTNANRKELWIFLGQKSCNAFVASQKFNLDFNILHQYKLQTKPVISLFAV